VTPTRANDAEPAEIPADIDNGDWPPEEPPIGWEQFARNWQDTARLCAGNDELVDVLSRYELIEKPTAEETE
jgi:hypothetical protein